MRSPSFQILGEKNVPEEKIPIRLTEVATHFAQTRDELAALEPDDPHTAELAGAAKTALDAGRLAEADNLLDQAKEAELAAFRQAREFTENAQAAEDRHALNAAKLLAGRGSIALTQFATPTLHSNSRRPRIWSRRGIRTQPRIAFTARLTRFIGRLTSAATMPL